MVFRVFDSSFQSYRAILKDDALYTGTLILETCIMGAAALVYFVSRSVFCIYT